ncbi:MAG TPA: hypothetical protein VGQ41_11045 [Pyrinomonadaceae bacterium]|nr:hypothetical protein [Pyrinomonadaceae bacterium]
MTYMRPYLFFITLILLANSAFAQNGHLDLRKSALKSTTPSDEVVRLDINNDGKPDILERWWNGKRVRWLDENGDMLPTDTRGDQIADVMQIDKNGDGSYDTATDINIKWADNDGDGRADMQAFATQGREWSNGTFNAAESHWMVFIDVEKDGVLGWLDWQNYDFGSDNWGYTGATDWLPDYNGNAIFLKVHRPPQSLPDPRLNWENPFDFFDFDGDGASEMAIRWLDPVPPLDKDVTNLSGVLSEAFATFDLDNDSTKGNETDYDMSLRGAGGPGIPYRQFVHKYPALKGNPKFDECFQWNNWRKIDELMYMPHEKSYDSFFTARWATMYFVFDEDDDDHRWERVEMYYPMHGFGGPKDIDLYSTKKWRRGNYAELAMAGPNERPGISGHPQADSLGDRGEFDEDNSGGGKLYVGVFDRKLHLGGAEWGAWTVDKNGEYHGGSKTPSSKPIAPKVDEVVKYTDTDQNGFLDTIEYDYDGDRTIDLKVSLLDYRTPSNPHPDVVPLIDTHKEGWKGLNSLFGQIASQSFQEGLTVYRAAWKRGLTTPEIDKLASASAIGERYDHGYWLKEKIFRIIRARLREAKMDGLEKDLTRLYYTGQFAEYARRIAEVPAI